MSITEVKEDLRALRMAREAHQEDRNWISLRTSVTINAARDEGMTPTEIAELAGVSRQTVHNILKENQ